MVRLTPRVLRMLEHVAEAEDRKPATMAERLIRLGLEQHEVTSPRGEDPRTRPLREDEGRAPTVLSELDYPR